MKIFKTQLLEAVTVKSDSRAPDKLHKSLKEMLELAMRIFLPFLKFIICSIEIDLRPDL